MSPLVKEVISKVLELFAQMKLLFPAIMSSSCEETSLCVPISTFFTLPCFFCFILFPFFFFSFFAIILLCVIVPFSYILQKDVFSKSIFYLG